tara:strand:- start:142 stop:603 length:462 start_codon:yes stop_codon:yes gene_type:complete
MKNFILFCLIIITTSCGFKVLKQSDLNFNIISIETTGDKRINFNLRNKFQALHKNTNARKIKLVLETKKEKTIKEKNSKNEITKYLTKVTLNIKIITEDDKIKTISLVEQIDYNVGLQNSQTINNEKISLKTLSNLLFDKTIKELSLLSVNDL